MTLRITNAQIMIVDAVENAEKYLPLNPRFAEAFRYLRSAAVSSLTSAHTRIDGENLFASASRKQGKKRSEATLEIHRKYIDIHYILAGMDSMGWKPARDCSAVLSLYEEDKDAAFFGDEPLLRCEIPAGFFVIFFPEDAHAAMVSDGEVHKVVLKAAV
jgi:biofilm protein TabA